MSEEYEYNTIEYTSPISYRDLTFEMRIAEWVKQRCTILAELCVEGSEASGVVGRLRTFFSHCWISSEPLCADESTERLSVEGDG